MSSKSLKRTAEIVVLCVCAAVVWGCESDAQKYAGELKIRHAICMNKAGTFNASASVQCLCENTPDLPLGSAFVCNKEGERVPCDTAPQVCESNGAGKIGRLTYCSAGVWKTGYCECNAEQNGCRECDENKDLPVCYSDNGRIISRYCKDGVFVFDECANGCNVERKCNQECNSAVKSKSCFDTDEAHVVRECEDGIYRIKETCNYGCKDAKCISECTENVCGDNALRICNEKGLWDKSEPCPFGCENGHCLPAPPECQTNVCVNQDNSVGYISICNNGTYNEKVPCHKHGNVNAYTSCANSHDCSKECKNGEKKCEAGIKYVCDVGQFVKTNDRCGENICEDGYYNCDDNTPHNCVNGGISKVKACSGDKPKCTFIDGVAQCTECEPDDAQCDVDGHYKLCEKSGSWSDSLVCAENIDVCKGNDNCAKCDEGEKKCDGDVFKECKNNKWNNTPCGEQLICVNGAGCVECNGDVTKCDDVNNEGVLSICGNDYKWNTVNCNGGVSCKDPYSCGDCKNGSSDCTSEPYKICVDGTLQSCEIEENKDLCTNICSPVICKLGASKCESGEPLVCNGSGWEPCSNTNFDGDCNSICPIGTCKDNYISCANEGDIGVLSICLDGVLHKSNCPNEAKCKDRTTCADCGGSATKCEGDTLKTCNGTGWTTTQCSGDRPVCDFIGGEGKHLCVECHPNTNECLEDKESRACNRNGEWENSVDCPNGCDPSTGECMDGPNRCDATKLTISADGFKYDGNLISDWSLECDNTKGLLIKDLGVCSTSIILATGGDCSKLPYKGYVGLDKMEGQKPVTLCKDTTLQMESGESNQGSYKLQFTIGKSLVTLNVSVCSSGCVGNVCSNMQNGKQCRCGSEMINSFTTCCSGGSPYICLGGDLIDCSGTSLCASTCNGKCSETNNTTITISNQLVTVCDKGVKQTYYMFSYACDDTDVIKKLNLYSGDTGPTLALTPYGTSTLDCNSLLNKDFDYPKGSTANTIISGSGTLCAVDANSASGGKFAFVFDDHEDPKSVHADKGVCNVCVDNAVCSTHSDCNGGVCVGTKNKKCLCGFKTQQCLLESGNSKCIGFNSDGDICNGSCKDSDCVCDATM